MSTPDTATADAAVAEEDTGVNWGLAITAGIMALLIGGLGAWATANLFGIAPVVFLIGLVGGAYYLYQKPLKSAAVGTGLYIMAIEMILTPIMFYLPVLFSTEGQEGAEAAGTAIGSVLGLVIWGFVFLLLAIVAGVIGYFANRRAKKKLNASVN
ncbi:hypothetical protein ACFPYI_01745 [Halomarina salina]|uniref:Uncharacterized protein n=1 Tax=Halomarina salina TaxID=1872699 RepID=A0ABD5RI67_9EURY|nr:hypothetical protein [Halomarina salina]